MCFDDDGLFMIVSVLVANSRLLLTDKKACSEIKKSVGNVKHGKMKTRHIFVMFS